MGNVSTAISLIFALVLSGCVSQVDADNLDKHWSAQNSKLMSVIGTKYFEIEPIKAHRAMLLTLSNLGMTVENQDSASGFILARSTAPRPLSDKEWDEVVKVSLPEVQNYMGPFVTMGGNNTDVIVNSFIIPRSNDVQVNLRFRTKYTGQTGGLIISDQAPPMAVKLGAAKIWDEFQKNAFVQAKVIQ
jgi:hypothetical protein